MTTMTPRSVRHDPPTTTGDYFAWSTPDRFASGWQRYQFDGHRWVLYWGGLNMQGYPTYWMPLPADPVMTQET